MKTWAVPAVLILLAIVGGECLQRRGPSFMLGRSVHGLRPPPEDFKKLFPTKADEPPALWFDQKVDHFDPSNNQTFKQRYFHNSAHYKAGGPIILMFGGEGPEEGTWAYAETLSYMEWARNFSADVFDLEHRFYGKSRPFEQQTTENLKYLSSRQAIEDVADFIRAMNKQQGYTNPRWIVYGGSYSAALALWFREKHPELTLGAVGSSAPMLAELDFHEYLEDVEEALSLPDWVTCRDHVTEGIKQMSALIWTEQGRDQLTAEFKLKPALKDPKLRHKDIQLFFQAIIGNFMGAVQYNRDNTATRKDSHGIPELCALMNNETIGDVLDRLQAVNVYMTEYYTSAAFNITDIDYDAMIEYLKDPTYDESGENAASRSWTWQTCTEFAYFQTTDYGKGMWGSSFPLNFYVDMCKDTFGDVYRAENIQESVHSSNVFYGGRKNYNATNAVLIYGTIDPWHKLGMYTNKDPSVVTYLINGTAHCADMYPSGPNDNQWIKEARLITYQNIQKWLGLTTSPHLAAESKSEELQRPQLKPFTSTVTAAKMTPNEIEATLQKNPPKPKPGLPLMMFGRPYHGLVPDPPGPAAANVTLIHGTITQPVDHFGSLNKTYQQHYWINDQYYKDGGPQFLFLEGESKARPEKWLLSNVTFMRAVQMYNARAYVLEHRFYGDSRPYDTMATENLKHFTTQQALADVAQFIETMNKQYNIQQPKWITFGGSYPGALSAWFRQQYPEYTVGAVASSTGTEVKLNYWEYLVVAEESLGHFSSDCVNRTKEAFLKMHSMSLTGSGRKQLSDIFKMDPPWTEATVVSTRDVQYFFQDVYDKFQDAVQYNNDNTGTYMNGGGIKEACQIMNNASIADVVVRVAELYKYIVNFHGGNFTKLDSSYQNYVDYINTTDYSDDDAASWRGWNYACCSEIGLLQPSDGDSVFASVTPVDFWLNLCEDVFGKNYMPARQIYDKVEATNELYRGRDQYLATNIVFVSGKIDPWHRLALSKARETDTMKVFLMNETAHCADMYPPRKEDPQELTDVRQKIFENIGNWIKNGNPETPTVPTTTLQPTTPSTTAPTAAVSTPVATAASSTNSKTAAVSTPVATAASSSNSKTAAVSTPVATAASSTNSKTAAVSTPIATAASSSNSKTAAVSTPVETAASSTNSKTAAVSTPIATAASSTNSKTAASSATSPTSAPPAISTTPGKAETATTATAASQHEILLTFLFPLLLITIKNLLY